MNDDELFKIEALSFLDHIHRTFTMADTREGAHLHLANFHENRYQSAVNKYRKTLNRANKYQPGTRQYDNLIAKSNLHLNNAKFHNDMLKHHSDKAYNLSEEGYDERKELKKQANDMLFKHATNMTAHRERFSDPVAKQSKYITPVKQSAEQISKIKTPKPIPGIEPMTKALKTNKTSKGPPMPPKPQDTLLKPLKPPHPPKVANNAAKLNIKAQPIMKPKAPAKMRAVRNG